MNFLPEFRFKTEIFLLILNPNSFNQLEILKEKKKKKERVPLIPSKVFLVQLILSNITSNIVINTHTSVYIHI